MKTKCLQLPLIPLLMGLVVGFLPSTLRAQSPIDPIQIDPIPVPDVVTVIATDSTGAEPERVPPGMGRPTLLDPIVFTFHREGPTDFELPVFYEVGGTADNGVDYEKLSGQILMPSGAAEVVLVVTPFDDGVQEPTEMVTIRVIPPICPAIFPQPRFCYQTGFPSSAKATIADNGVATDNQVPSVTITQPQDGAILPEKSSITVEADAVDADGYAPRVEFFANDQKIGESSLVFIQAPKPGTVLHHSIQWSDIPLGSYTLIAVAHDDRGATSKSAAIHLDVVPSNSIPPVVEVVATDAVATEPKTPLPTDRFAIDRGQFTITRTGGDLSRGLQVVYQLSGTALNGLDYDFTPNVVIIPAGTNSVVVDIFPINDQRIEPTETVILKLLPRPIVIRVPVSLDPSGSVGGASPGDPNDPGYDSVYRVGKADSATLEIIDNGEGPGTDLPEVNVTATDDSATEPPTDDPAARYIPDNGVFTITRTGSTVRPLHIWVGFSGTAKWGVNGAGDYELPGEVVIPVGATSVDVPIVPHFDRIQEKDETVILTILESPILVPVRSPVLADDVTSRIPVIIPLSPYRVGAHADATVTIHDNGLVPENQPPTVKLTHPLADAQFVAPADIAVVAETQDPDGYVSWVEFFAGKEKIGESRIDFFRAPDPGTVITHSFDWKAVPAGDYSLTAVAHDDGGLVSTSAPVNIHVVGVVPTTVVTVEATDPVGTEPTPLPPGIGLGVRPDVIVFTLTRQGDLSVGIPVDFHLEGTAKAGSDYHVSGSETMAGSRMVRFPKGVSSVRVTVTPIDDDIVEGDESVVLVIDPPVCLAVAKPQPACYQVGDPSTAKAVIHDNDPVASLPPKVSITVQDAIATEGTSSWASPEAVLVIHRTGNTNTSITVGLKITGTAVAGKDYDALPDEITIPAGVRRVPLKIHALDDNEVEPIETVQVELLEAATPTPRPIGWPAYVLGQPTKALAIILDNDAKRPVCQRLAEGHFHLCVPIDPGTDPTAEYQLEVSTDLVDWTSKGVVGVSDGAIHFIDPDATPSAGSQFYRIVGPVVPEDAQ